MDFIISLLQNLISGDRAANEEQRRWVRVQDAWSSWARERSVPLDWDTPDTWPMVRRPLSVFSGAPVTIGLRGREAYLAVRDDDPVGVTVRIRARSRVRRLLRFGCEDLGDGHEMLTMDFEAARGVFGPDVRDGVKRLGCPSTLVYRDGDVKLSWPASRLDGPLLGTALDTALAAVHRRADRPYR
jgi:hypothetical protein